MEAAAPRSCSRWARSAVLIKGGHLPGDTRERPAADAGGRAALAARAAHRHRQHARHRLHAVQRHRRAPGARRDAAAGGAAAREFVRGALAAGAAVRTGAGSGPLNHGYAPHADAAAAAAMTTPAPARAAAWSRRLLAFIGAGRLQRRASSTRWRCACSPISTPQRALPALLPAPRRHAAQREDAGATFRRCRSARSRS